MDYNSKAKVSLSHHQTSRKEKEKIPLTGVLKDPNLRGRPKSAKLLSYAQYQNGVKYSIASERQSVQFQSSRTHQEQKIQQGKEAEEGELVKYMSKLPSYLQRVERGENVQDKALNFGVLDWGRLEKWKDTQKHIPANTISSSVGSSPVFCKSDSSLAAHQRKQSPVFQQDQRKQSPVFPHAKPLGGKAAVFQKPVTFSNEDLAPRQTISTIISSIESSKMILDKGKGKLAEPKIIKNLIPSSSNPRSHDLSFSPTGKIYTRASESMKPAEQFKEFRLPDQHSPGTQKTIVLLLPTDERKSCSGVPSNSSSKNVSSGASTETSRFSDSFYVNKDAESSGFYPGISHSCPLPSIGESSTPLNEVLCKPVISNIEKVDISKNKQASIDLKAHYTPSSPKVTKSEVPKRFMSPGSSTSSTIDLGQMSRSFSAREVSGVPKLNSTYVVAKSGPVGSDAFPCKENSERDKTNANNRGKSSPLRRLLDPFLKPKAANSQSPSVDSAQDETIPSVKRTLKFASSESEMSGDSNHGELSMVQALLKVTVKEGLPSFTFAVDKNSDILAATMKKADASGKYDCSWIYTFFTFQKAKKKSGRWMKQGSKSKNLDYVPKVAGRMKVASCGSPKVTRQSSRDQYMTREFVLMGAECREPNGEILENKLDCELAAIVVKVPREIVGRNLSTVGFQEDVQIDSNGRSRSLFSTTVILPSGMHGLPSTGVPSPLIERWRTGGLCDCGGWDVGCELRILGSQNQRSKNLTLFKDFCTLDQLELFLLGGSTSDSPWLSLGTFEEGIYTISFNASSISSLQAFSISTAILHSRKLAELSEMSRMLEDKISVELVSTENSRVKDPVLNDEEIPPTYVIYPPVSPAGRV